jgi:thiamine-phosphate pyrophosphorylase
MAGEYPVHQFPQLRVDNIAIMNEVANLPRETHEKLVIAIRAPLHLEAGPELAALEVLASACRRHGALLAVNDRADVALAAGAHVLHLGQHDLPVSWARRILGDEVVIGLSTHDPAQAANAAAQPGVDYFCTGPCWPTPTKPGRPAAGLDLVRSTRANIGPARPWFAIGGFESIQRLEEVRSAGAERVVVVRAITEATDPQRAAAAFAQLLRSLP